MMATMMMLMMMLIFLFLFGPRSLFVDDLHTGSDMTFIASLCQGVMLASTAPRMHLECTRNCVAITW